MTDALFRQDAYQREATAQVTSITPEGGIVLDRTVFYPSGGGQPGDSGRLDWDASAGLAIATAIKGLRFPPLVPLPMDQAISTAGGLRFEALDEGLMLRARPGVFAAGEMLDWEAPTGGYLITGCLATGRHAGLAALDYL